LPKGVWEKKEKKSIKGKVFKKMKRKKMALSSTENSNELGGEPGFPKSKRGLSQKEGGGEDSKKKRSILARTKDWLGTKDYGRTYLPRKGKSCCFRFWKRRIERERCHGLIEEEKEDQQKQHGGGGGANRVKICVGNVRTKP